MRSTNPRKVRLQRPAAALAALLPLSATALADWPQYNGPAHDRTVAATLGLRAWGADGPPQAWKVAVGTGFSSFAVGGGRLYTLVGARSEGEEVEACIALDAASGKELWRTPLGQAEYDGGGDAGAEGNSGGDGPRSTPSLDGERVYVLDGRLVLYCLSAEDGSEVWARDLVAEHEGRNITWQNAASPLLVGERVLVAGGGPGQSLLAFDKESGELAWKTGDEKMTHATPVLAEIHGTPQAIFLVQSGLVAVAPDTGAELWRAEFPYRTSTAASPVVDGDLVYCSAGYGVGAACFRVSRSGEGFEAEPVWRKQNRLMNHWSTPVCKDGMLYGIFGFKEYGEAPLQCVELATGEIKWSTEGFGPGNCILVGEDLVALSDAGELVLVAAEPDAYRELARADVLSGKCWSTPAFSAGQVYVRSTEQAARLDLSAP